MRDVLTPSRFSTMPDQYIYHENDVDGIGIPDDA